MQAETEVILRGGRVVCPVTGTDAVTDVVIRNGLVHAVGAAALTADARVIDCAGCVVSHGFTDLGAELGDPGQTWREDLSTGSEAGAAGGYTTVVCSPRTDPVLDTPVAVAELRSRAATVTGARIEVAGALTVGLQGEVLSELGLMAEAGVVAFSDGGKAMSNAALLRRALDYARPFGLPVWIRPGNVDLEGSGVMHEGVVSSHIGLRGIPAAAEELGVARGIAFARLTKTSIHLSHVTTKTSVEQIRRARAEGLSVTAAAPARHLVLTDQAVDDSVYDTATRLLPPLRPESDRRAVVEAVLDGTVGSVFADHVPLTRLEKEVEYMFARPGAMGLETALSAALTATQDVSATVKAMAVAPAALVGRRAAVEPGAAADLVVFDPGADRVVSGPFRSKGSNEPLVGLSLKGEIVLTMRDGCIIYGPRTS